MAKRRTWDEWYQDLVEYKRESGDCDISTYYVTKKGFKLGRWINHQRTFFKAGKLTKEQVKLLNEIGMIWDICVFRWNQYYQLANSYYEYYGNLEISQKFKTFDGVNYNKNGYALGNWVGTQRRGYRENTLTPDKIEKLNKLDMIWNCYDDSWDSNYQLAKNYYEHHRNLNVPQKFKTKNGYEYDEDGIDLEQWINRQKNAYAGYGAVEITKKQIDLLNNIGIIWRKTNEEKWNEGYNYLSAFFEKYHHCLVSTRYLCQDGFKLGAWVHNQRMAYKKRILNINIKSHQYITMEQVKKLEKIGFVFLTTPEDKGIVSSEDYYIYGIKQKSKNKVIYVGQTNDYTRREREHFSTHRNIVEINKKLYKAMDKYGYDDFEMFLIKECTAVEANILEAYYTDFYKTIEKGYQVMAPKVIY